MEELMYIDIFKNNGTEYLRLRESYRTKTLEGKVAIRKRIICNIGPFLTHSHHLTSSDIAGYSHTPR